MKQSETMWNKVKQSETMKNETKWKMKQYKQAVS